MKQILNIGFFLNCFILMVQISIPNLVAQTTSVKKDSLFDLSLFNQEITNPTYSKNNGTIIYLDEGHYNRHIYGGLGNFIAFKNVLSNDGYRIVAFKNVFTSSSLQDVSIMVIALPQNKINLGVSQWHNPTYSAFERLEIVAIKKWVENGGALFFIVDHHPFAGAAKDLAKEFGFTLFNGHALDTIRYPSYFHRTNNTLHSNIITNGLNNTERIDSILTFSGASMKLPNEATSILTFDDGWLQWIPETSWDFKNVESESISGFSQGAYLRILKGKIVIFLDGNMFSAQDTDWGGKMGFIDPNAKYNHQLLLNIIHYLDGLLD